MDSPASWFILLVLAIGIAILLFKQAESERNRYQFENDEFFRKRNGRF